MHYQRKKFGRRMDVPKYAKERQSVTERFWRFVDKRGPEDCWLWTGSGARYGHIIVAGVNYRSHRLAYELANGPIPKGDGYHGVCVCHRCDNKLCCNPAHLFLGTQAENLADMRAKNRGVISHRKGEAHHKAKLNDAAVRGIRSALASGQTGNSVAKQFGISNVVVSRIKLGKLWSHVV